MHMKNAKVKMNKQTNNKTTKHLLLSQYNFLLTEKYIQGYMQETLSFFMLKLHQKSAKWYPSGISYVLVT